MNCARHPNKRAVVTCKDCGADFCIECVRETDQTRYCYDCYRRRLSEIAREYSGPPEEEAKAGGEPLRAARPATEPVPPKPADAQAAGPSPAPAVAVPPGGAESVPLGREAAARRPAKPAAKKKRPGRGRRAERVRKPAPTEAAGGAEDFLAQGPDEDFSALKETRAARMRPRTARAERERGEAERPSEEAVPVSVDEPAEAAPGASETPVLPVEETPAAAAPKAEENLLDDVVSTLLRPEAAGTGTATTAPVKERRAAPAEAVPEPAPRIPAEVPAEGGARSRRAAAKEAAREEKRARREKKPASEGAPGLAERWSFLAQPRSSEYTIIAVTWWRASGFVALMLLAGAALWAVPNAFLIPKDQEYGIHAVVIGIGIGLAFWWKAGRKHSSKLALQAALTTFFALLLGEFLHWFLIVLKNEALRTVLFDFISFKFIWESGPEVLSKTVATFLWILVLPSALAFIIGFGLPPIPEVFFQIARALRGAPETEKEAKHGLEGQ